MTMYGYNNTSYVKEVVFHQDQDRLPTALLSAGVNAASNKLNEVRAALKQAGWESIPTYAEGKPVLQVSGFKKESELDHFLRSHNFVNGQAAISGKPKDQPVLTPRQRISQKSLKLAGVFDIVGDLGLVADGVKERDPYRITSGSLFMLAAATLTRFGNAKPEKFKHQVIQDLQVYAHTQTGALPQDKFATGKLASGSLSKVKNFLYRNPAQVSISISEIGAVASVMSGLKRKAKTGESSGLGFGLALLAVKVAALVIPEQSKKQDEQNGPSTDKPHNKILEWVKEKPLRIYGYGMLIADICLGYQSIQQFKRGNATGTSKMGGLYTAGAGVFYMLEDVLMAISNKDHVNANGKFTADEQRGIESLAAQTVAAQPANASKPLAEKMGRFLAKHKEMQGDADSISQYIMEQARHRPENPWAQRTANTDNNLAALKR